jgi:NAD(P)-dependent dehydrogenase (short-subunit alcohol dehydrogenase family)
MLNRKIVVVTGGAGLLGREFIKSIVENNGIGIIAELDDKRGIAVEKEIRETLKTKDVFFHKLDITSKASILALIENIKSKYKKIDAIVNNAYPRNKNFGKHFFEVDYVDFCENVSTNLGGYFLVSQQFAQFFQKQGYGNIVNISSIYGVIPPRFEIYKGTKMSNPVEYAVIKSGLIHLTKYMSKYLKGKNIRVNTISPGGIFDNQPEPFLSNYKAYCMNKGMLNISDITGTLLFLLSDMSSFINGQNIIVDDGFSL